MHLPIISRAFMFLAFAGVGVAAVTYSDGFFPNANWSLSKIYDDTPGMAAAATGTQIAAGGFPAQFRQVEHTWTIGMTYGTLRFLHLNAGAIYGTALAGIPETVLYIDYSYDLERIQATNNGSIAYSIAIRQGGKVFSTSPLDTISVSAWTHFARTHLTPANFCEVKTTAAALDCSSHPDFNCGAPMMELGFLSHNSAAMAGNYKTVSGIDNWTVTLYSAVQYSAKFICGRMQEHSLLSAGEYFTAINVHSPCCKPVEFRKKIAIALPSEKAGKVSQFFPVKLNPDEALEIDCADIRKHAEAGPDQFIKGFVVLETPWELDVVAVYTTTATRVESLSTERVPPRRLRGGASQ